RRSSATSTLATSATRRCTCAAHSGQWSPARRSTSTPAITRWGCSLELTVLGGSPAWPNPGQAASGYLIERGEVRMLVDCGTGIAGVLRDRDPGPLTHILISHFHADHWFDLVPLHFLYLYGAWHDRDRPHLFLPPGGRDTVDRVATIWNGSIASFDRAFEVSEYDPSAELVAGDLQVRFAFTHHYCTCFAMRFDTPAATIAYT